MRMSAQYSALVSSKMFADVIAILNSVPVQVAFTAGNAAVIASAVPPKIYSVLYTAIAVIAKPSYSSSTSNVKQPALLNVVDSSIAARNTKSLTTGAIAPFLRTTTALVSFPSAAAIASLTLAKNLMLFVMMSTILLVLILVRSQPYQRGQQRENPDV